MTSAEKLNVLIIDDDPDLCELLRTILIHEKMNAEIALSGEEGIGKVVQSDPDLVLLDIMMPDLSGWEVTRRIRKETQTPIIVLSALTQTGAIVRALEAGADDFISKPFNKGELIARIQALLRRTVYMNNTGFTPGDYDDGHLSVDLRDGQVYLLGESQYLSPTEFKLFEFLFQNAGRVCSTVKILEHVWGGLIPNGVNYLHVYIWKLRSKIEPDPSNPIYLHTEHGIGYRFMRRGNV